MNVFISYTRESIEHDQRVARLAERIITELAFECDFDQFHSNQNWPAWMEERLAWADRVLVITTPTYHKRWTGTEEPGVGLGAKWESLLTRQQLYEMEGKNEKFVPVVFSKQHVRFIPQPLRGYTRVVLQPGGSLEDLRLRLLAIAPVKRPTPPLAATAKLDDAYFPDFALPSGVSPNSRAATAEHYDRNAIGISPDTEEIISNIFPIEYPATFHAAKPTKRTGRKSLIESISYARNAIGGKGQPPQDYVFEGNVIYRLSDFTEEPWAAMLRTGRLRRLSSQPTTVLSESLISAEKSLFIKLLTRCLTELCRSHDMAFSKDLKCHFFVATNSRKRIVTVKSLSKSGTRELSKAIPDKRAPKPDVILHWQHQAFRHRFIRFGRDWFISITPFWAFTSDGISQKSRFQRSWSSKLRKPERNRAVLGHVLMWSSILSREPDMLRRYSSLRIKPPIRLTVSPSVVDSDWVRLSRANEKAILEQDLTVTVDDETGSNLS